MDKEEIKIVIQDQRHELKRESFEIKRELKISSFSDYCHIITGIRRCGKSTLMKHIALSLGNFYYLNFDDERLSLFKLEDFQKLYEAFIELYGTSKHIFFDEIQNIAGWEKFVRRMLDSKKVVFITGSNASMLSPDFGTKLTGRHINYILFPFSFREYLKFRNISANKPKTTTERVMMKKHFDSYLSEGGFPGYLKIQKKELLQEIFKDILFRDIIAKHNIKKQSAIRELSTFLISNVSKEISSNKLKSLLNLGSVNTVADFLKYMEESYLFFAISRFDYSYRKQVAYPKKIYCIDTALASSNSVSFSKDTGRAFENAVFLELKRRYKNIYYFREKHECDFIIGKGNPSLAVQCCYNLTSGNLEREISGLKEAMKTLKIKKGLIINSEKEKLVEKNIRIIPAWKFFLRK